MRQISGNTIWLADTMQKRGREKKQVIVTVNQTKLFAKY